MTKLGTPIGAGPNIAKVVVGFAAVGEPPSSNAALPPLPAFAGWTPPVAGGAVTAPLAPTPAASPEPSRSWLRLAPPESGASPALRDEPDSTPPAGWLGAGSGPG